MRLPPWILAGPGLGAAALLAFAPSEGSPAPDGRALYRTHCAACHGPQGRGDGPGAALNHPRPRDFATGQFRLVSARNRFPSRDDLFRTLTRGIPGTGMPAWGHLSEGDRWALVDAVLALSRDGIAGGIEKVAREQGSPLPREEIRGMAATRATAGAPLDPPPMPPATPERIASGRAHFLESCSSCHGEDTRGMRDPEWLTAEGEGLGSRDLVAGTFKGEEDPVSLYRRIEVGIPGAPMPALDAGDPDYVWDLVHYLRSIRVEPPPPEPLGTVWFPASVNSQGRLIEHDFYLTLAVTGAVGLLALGGLVAALLRSRLGSRGAPPWRPGDRRVFAAWIAIPTVIVLVMIVNSWNVYRSLIAPIPDALHVKVTGRQFFWSFDYPGQHARSAGVVAVPAGRSVHFELSSDDVIHSFYLPHLKMKRDAIPGLTTHLWVAPIDKPGRYPILCNQLCGTDHAIMIATLEVLPAGDFDRWLALRKE